MKKVVSILLTACMLLSAMAISAAAAIVPLDPIENTNTYIPTPVEVLKFTTPPTIDGVISKDEWAGNATIKFGVATAATTIYSPHPELAEAVSADNTFWDPYYTTLTEEQYNKMKTQVWFRYDDNYLYVAAKVLDVTGVVNKKADEMENIWNGDALEITVDPEGPNSGMFNFDGTKIGANLNPGYDWTTTPFDQTIFNEYRTGDETNVNNNYRKCWIRDLQKKNDFVFAKSFWDDEVYGYETQAGREYWQNAGITVDDNGDGTYYINYEIRLKWNDVLRTYKKKINFGPGLILGCVVSVTEAWDMDLQSDWRYYDSCYCWGGGHFGGWAQDAPNSAGGTNAIVLSATEVTPYETPFEDDESEPEPEPLPPVIEEGGGKNEVDDDDIVVEDPSTGDGTGEGEGTGTGTGDGTGTSTPSTVKTFKIPVKADANYKTLTGELVYTFAFNTEKFVFDSIVGLDESDYKLELNADGTCKLTITNIEKVKAVATGEKLFDVALKSKEGVEVETKDIKFSYEDKYEYQKPAATPNKKPSSPATGDEFVIVAAVAVVALAAFAVATKKRRFN